MEDPDLKQKWFDHWLQGADNGVENTPPVNLYPIGGDRWEHHSTWPLPDATYTPAYLGRRANRSSFTAPAARRRRQGAAAASVEPVLADDDAVDGRRAQGPCETDNRTWEASSLTYTSDAARAGHCKLTGPLVANVWAELTSKDATLVERAPRRRPVGRVEPGHRGLPAREPARGRSGPIVVRPERHVMIRPFHPFTRESQQPVTPNDPALYRIEIYPTSAIFRKGDRIRLTIGSADTPATSPAVPALADSLGGEIRVLHGGRYESHVLLPFAPG